MFCKHDWEVLSETTSKSRVELALELGMTINKGYASDLERKHIQTFTCSKCGKFKRFVEVI